MLHKNRTEVITVLNRLKKMNFNTNGACIEMYRNRELDAVGCKCVCDYEKDFIKLDFGEFRMLIRGSELVVQSFVYEQVSVCGNIASVEFEGAGR